VRDQVVTFIVAGHETVASALTWAWDLLAHDASATDRLRAEADALDAAPSYEDLPRLPYTAAVMDETLRLYPPAWVVTRRALEDDVLAGVPIAADSLVIVSPWLVHRHGAVWDDAEEFRPERFLDDAGARRRDLATSSVVMRGSRSGSPSSPPRAGRSGACSSATAPTSSGSSGTCASWRSSSGAARR